MGIYPALITVLCSSYCNINTANEQNDPLYIMDCVSLVRVARHLYPVPKLFIVQLVDNTVQ